MSILQHLNAISHSRLTPYRLLCRNAYPDEPCLVSEKRVVCTYTALQHRASIFLSLIQEIEISVRNEITRIMKSDLANHQNLLDYFCFLAINRSSWLSPHSQDQLKKCLIDSLPPNVTHINNQAYAYRRLQQENVSEGDIISKLMFGFWVNLLDSDRRKNPNYLNWNNAFYNKLFGNRFNTMASLFNELRDVRDFRNRLSHQDAIWNKSARTPKEALKNMKNTYQRFNTILNKLSPSRHAFREVSTYLTWQESLNFDEEVFIAEIREMMKTSFI